ncbi:twin-arginine translocation signal domain-containing protein [Thalassospiraceae bacterium SW-3-3]|nr:twin-arginine translocation signal domain-containing protein [Thalassospiraceae bacterium SW-3-3]
MSFRVSRRKFLATTATAGAASAMGWLFHAVHFTRG